MKKAQSEAKEFIRKLVAIPLKRIPDDEVELSLQETKKLEFLVQNGHWETLVKNKTFLILAPEGQVQTLARAMEHRIAELGITLMPLGRSERTRDAYIQVLNHIHDLEKIKEEMLKKFYANLGKRQIDKDSKGRKIYF